MRGIDRADQFPVPIDLRQAGHWIMLRRRVPLNPSKFCNEFKLKGNKNDNIPLHRNSAMRFLLPPVFANTVIAAVMLIGLGATIFGLSVQNWPEVLPFGLNRAFRDYLIFIVVTTLLAGLANKYSHLKPVAIGIILAITIALVSSALWALFVVLWFAVASVLLGRFVLRLLGLEQTSVDLTTNFAVGAGVYGTSVGLLAHLPINYPGIYGLALAVPLLLGWRQVAELSMRMQDILASRDTKPCLDWLGIGLVVVALVHFVVALMPEMMFDALALHLLVPVHLSSRHQWGFDPSLYALALIPMLGDWLFSIGYMLAGETGARLINLSFTFVLAWQARELVLWGGGNERGGKWAALLFLATPLTFTETSSLFVEGVWAAFFVAGTMAMLRVVSSSTGNTGAELKITGLMLGFAAAAKAVTLTILPALLLLFFYPRRRFWLTQDIGKAILIGLALFLAFGAIPYFTAWAISENPFYPFFNGYFKSPYYYQANFDNTLFKSGVSWALPYLAVFDSGKYLESSNGASGFQWLLLLPPTVVLLLISGNRRALFLLAIAVIAVALVFNFQSYLRYVFPASLLLTAVIGVALSSQSDSDKPLAKIFQLIAIFTLGLNLLFLSAGTWPYRDFPLSILVSDSSREDYIERRLPVRRAVEFVNYINKQESPVAIFGQPFGAGLKADALYPNWYNHLFQEGISNAKDAQAVGTLLSGYGSSFVLLDAGWGEPEKRRFIEQATNQVAAFGQVSVRAVRDEYRFGTELLKNSDFGGSDGWVLSQGAIADLVAGTISVSVSNPATQVVVVRAGTNYVNEVTARCGPTPSPGRLQINWHDTKMKFIAASIQVFDCSPEWKDYRQMVTAPKSATTAIVYAASHTTTPVEFTRISFR